MGVLMTETPVRVSCGREEGGDESFDGYEEGEFGLR